MMREYLNSTTTVVNDEDGVELEENAILICSKPADKKKKSQWTEEMERELLKELVVRNPFQFRRGSQERGKVWEQVALALEPLNKGEKACSFSQRTVRDKYKALANKQRINDNKEKAASGISPEETEIEKEIRQLIEQLQEMELDGDNIPTQKRDEEEKKKMDGIEMQNVMLERFSETKMRQNGEGTPQRKRRNNGSETFSILEKKIKMDQEFRKDETMRRREEEERKNREEKERERRFILKVEFYTDSFVKVDYIDFF
ncbi:PREDICTED: inner centromere protein A-like [Priapulus caudatus]|uniref:Inner centromere protein A-like n=1 Tax=Priapulus caudatus TaxID=37621 RepID=A0ABM1ERJ5_PRICU|nr:PREDICTED: inner centromere protein A-like [Priapulus caudatus]